MDKWTRDHCAVLMQEEAQLTLSSSVIFDKRASTLRLENPCPVGPSLLPRVRAMAKHIYTLQLAHTRKPLQLQQSSVCIPQCVAKRGGE